jgi:hypothetical protein
MPNNKNTNLQSGVLSLTRVHFALVAVYAVIILASDAWGLVTRQLTFQRWEAFGAMLITTAIIGYLARENPKRPTYYHALVFGLVIMDILLATFTVYTERGMASRGVMLYAIPIVSSAVLMRRRAVLATAIFCVSAYVMAATRYFYVNFNEGYKIELYATLALYSAVFLILATIIGIVLKPSGNK